MQRITAYRTKTGDVFERKSDALRTEFRQVQAQLEIVLGSVPLINARLFLGHITRLRKGLDLLEAKGREYLQAVEGGI
jgi:hypothetical protein